MPITFILNDQSKVNSYGFRTLNDGIDLARFRANPVILSDHKNSTATVIGRWENIRLSGDLLQADPVFDLSDKEAKKIAKKVEGNFLKACSMGLNFDWDYMQKNVDTGVWELKQCEIMEASIVAVPSNANAVKLYNTSGEQLKADEVQLKLSDEFVKPQNTNQDMNKIVLTGIALLALGIQSTENAVELSAAIEKMAKEHGEMKAKLAAIDADAKAKNKLAAVALINKAIAEGKLTAEVKDTWTEMAEANLEGITKTIEGMPGKKSLAATVDNSAEDAKVKTADDFEALSDEAKLAFKEKNPEAYQNLFKD